MYGIAPLMPTSRKGSIPMPIKFQFMIDSRAGLIYPLFLF